MTTDNPVVESLMPGVLAFHRLGSWVRDTLGYLELRVVLQQRLIQDILAVVWTHDSPLDSSRAYRTLSVCNMASSKMAYGGWLCTE